MKKKVCLYVGIYIFTYMYNKISTDNKQFAHVLAAFVCCFFKYICTHTGMQTYTCYMYAYRGIS